MKLNDKIYQIRFHDLKFRSRMWEVLVKHFFQKFIGKSDTVLDLACGYGHFINNISCKTRIAVDINEDSTTHLGDDVVFHKASSLRIPLQDESVDKVFVSNFFEHLTRKESQMTISEIRRVLKSGGEVLILQPNIRFCGVDYWRFWDHLTPIDDRALDEIFFAHDFTLVKKILRFLPYSAVRAKVPKNPLIVRAYLLMPFLWPFFGKQSFVIYRR